MNKYRILLITITTIGFFLRFYQLGVIPVGFHRDEAFLGFNAYAIIKTAKDMTGNFLPLHLQSFLYSPAGYSYFSTPFIALFGLSAFSVRFASALFGSLTILCCYLLVRELFFKEKIRDYLALFSAGLLAISPWHINLSRVATENVIVVFFLSFGVWAYLLWIRKRNNIFFVVAFLAFMITLVIYQAPRPFLPLFLPCLFFFTRPYLSRKQLLLTLGAFCICIIIPVIYILHSPELSTRIRMLSIFQSPQTQLIVNEQIREDGISNSPYIVTRIFHNKFSGYMTSFLKNYFSHFTYEFLFTDAGLPDRYRVAGVGLLYLFDIPFLIFGTWVLLHKYRSTSFILLAWILIAPIGSALTYDDVPNLQRTLLIFPVLSCISGIGFYESWILFTSKVFSTINRVVICFVLLLSFFYYLHAYYVHQIYHRPWYREEGFADLVPAVNTLDKTYEHVVITSSQSDPAIFFLFYNKFSPERFQLLYKAHPTIAYGEFSFGKYLFTNVDCPAGGSEFVWDKRALYVNGGSCDIPKTHAQVIKTIRRRDQTPVFTLLRYVP